MGVALDNSAIAAIFTQPDIDGRAYGELAEYLLQLGKRRPVVLFTFPPKAAGTFLRTAAIKATGGQLIRTVYAQGGREDQFYLPVLIEYYLGGLCEGPLVTHVHMQARPANRRFIEALSMKPIMMIRSIPDMLASLWDMFLSDDMAQLRNTNCEVPEEFAGFTLARKADFMIDMIAPWYVSYFASWLDYAAARPDLILLLRYGDFLENPEDTLEDMLEHVGLPQSPEVCRAALDATWQTRSQFRFNKGVSGRGREYFSPAHYARIERIMAHYPVLEAYHGDLL